MPRGTKGAKRSADVIRKAPAALISLPSNWCRVEIARGVDPEKPGIYEWHIAGVGTYIGKYTNPRRPRKNYATNVQNLLNGLKYHNRGDDYRKIHKALAKAHRKGRIITLTYLQNEPNPARRTDLEERFIEHCGS